MNMKWKNIAVILFSVLYLVFVILLVIMLIRADIPELYRTIDTLKATYFNEIELAKIIKALNKDIFIYITSIVLLIISCFIALYFMALNVLELFNRQELVEKMKKIV